MTEATLTGVRWSSAVTCTRAAVYQGLGAPESKPTPEQIRVRRRGTFIGQAIAKDITASYAEDGVEVEAEKVVPWPRERPIGEGHADLFIPSEHHVVEVVSSRDCALPAYKVVQVAGYAVNLGARKASVLSIDPSSYEERVYPVEIDAFRDEVKRIEGEVVRGVESEGAEMPERAGAHPGDFPCFWCAFKDTCWDGVEYPDPDRLNDPHLTAALQRLADIDDRISIGGKTVEHLKAERDEIRARLRPHIKDKTDTIAGGIKVKVTPVAGPERFDLGAATKTGHALPEHLRTFVTRGKGYDRWSLRRLG